jgi:hypothetical protein
MQNCKWLYWAIVYLVAKALLILGLVLEHLGY